MRNRFDQQLELLNEQLTRMGELCEVAIGKATTRKYGTGTEGD